MATKLVYIGVAVLAVIAVILGYKIYQQQTAINNPPPVTQKPQNRSTPKPLVNQATPGATQQSADRREVLNFPGPNATEEERKKWGEKVISLAQTADILEISSCKALPVVLLVKQETEVKVKNTGQVEVTLFAFSSEYNLPSGSTIPMKINPKEGKGNHGYTCRLEGGSQIPAISGIFLVN